VFASDRSWSRSCPASSARASREESPVEPLAAWTESSFSRVRTLSTEDSVESASVMALDARSMLSRYCYPAETELL
jgi:hypothetical protein